VEVNGGDDLNQRGMAPYGPLIFQRRYVLNRTFTNEVYVMIELSKSWRLGVYLPMADIKKRRHAPYNSEVKSAAKKE
jgi:hypothetical protein